MVCLLFFLLPPVGAAGRRKKKKVWLSLVAKHADAGGSACVRVEMHNSGNVSFLRLVIKLPDNLKDEFSPHVSSPISCTTCRQLGNCAPDLKFLNVALYWPPLLLPSR